MASEGAEILLSDRLLGEPLVQSLEQGGDFVGRESDGVGLEVIFQPKSRAAGGRRNKMAGGVGEGDAEVLAQLDELVVLELGEVGWRHGHGVVDIRVRGVLAA